MNSQAGRFLSYFRRAGAAREVLTLLIACFAVVLFSTAGFARIVGWLPASTDDSGDILALDETAPVQTMSEARANARCAECGMIVSMREIERHDQDSGAGKAAGATAGNRDAIRVKTARNYEITIRMADGSSRVIGAANPATWRTGERLIVIAGAIPSDQ